MGITTFRPGQRLYIPGVRVITPYHATSTLVLDGISNVAAAYGLRQLRSAYAGSAVRIRRSSDSTEQDIGFSGGEFDSASFSSFIGGGSGFVKTWYDQSGNGRDASQTTTTQQGSIVLTGINSKPAILFDATDDGMATGSLSLSQPYSIIFTARRTVDLNTNRVVQSTTTNALIALRRGANGCYVNGSVSNYQNTTNDEVASLVHSSNTATFRLHGVDRTNASSNSNNWGGVRIGYGTGAPPNAEPVDGYIAEMVFLSAALSTADHNTIGGDMGTRYGISWTTVT